MSIKNQNELKHSVDIGRCIVEKIVSNDSDDVLVHKNFTNFGFTIDAPEVVWYKGIRYTRAENTVGFTTDTFSIMYVNMDRGLIIDREYHNKGTKQEPKWVYSRTKGPSRYHFGKLTPFKPGLKNDILNNL